MSDHAPRIDELPWGSHLCQLFANGDDLRDAIVPYFKAGLENNERCLLVAMDPFGADDARSALRAAVGDFGRRELAKQIEVHDVRTWYAAAGAIESGQMADGLLRSEEQARADGFKDENSDRVSLAGPVVVLGARPAMAFGMALHELTTNAVKHGALSPRGGKLEVVWKRIADGMAFE